MNTVAVVGSITSFKVASSKGIELRRGYPNPIFYWHLVQCTAALCEMASAPSTQSLKVGVHLLPVAQTLI